MTTAASGLLGLTALRQRALAVLEPAAADDPPVFLAPVDAIEPPALMLAWGDPWVTFGTPCFWTCHLEVVLWAARIEPEPAHDELERLLDFTVGRFKADSYPWPHETTRAPRMVEMAGIPLLSARVVYAIPVTVGGS